MKVSSQEINNMENNEQGFFSLWSKAIDLDSAKLFLNGNFPDDLLFNRVSASYSKQDYNGLVDEALTYFQKAKIRPTFFIAEHHRKLEQDLLKKSFKHETSFNIMKLKKSVPFPDKIAEVSIADEENIAVWILTYMKSFDIGESFKIEVSKRAKKCLENKDCILYIARVGGEPVGTSLTYIEANTAGFYCIGTIPKFRGRGIASQMLEIAIRDARKQSDLLCLQNLEIDNVKSFYEKRGFETVFVKKVYQR
jgi:ribosomal protein S18 acetylase RimI-like enzyme